MKFTVKANKDSAVAHTFSYEVGATLPDMVALFGEGIVHEKATDSIIISAQSICRKALEGGMTPADVQAKLDAWKPGARASRVTVRPMTTAEIIAGLQNGTMVLTDDEKLALMKSLGM